VAQVKTAPQNEEYFHYGGPAWNLVRTFFYHARRLDDSIFYEQRGSSLVDDLDTALRSQNSVVEGVYKTVLLSQDLSLASGFGRLWSLEEGIVIESIQTGLVNYVENAIDLEKNASIVLGSFSQGGSLKKFHCWQA
jgi:hypothetical protein